jgi:hypothetical protein
VRLLHISSSSTASRCAGIRPYPHGPGANKRWNRSRRLAATTSNSFGKSPDELRRVLDDRAAIEPRLRRIADHAVVTTAPLHEVVTAILRLVLPDDARSPAQTHPERAQRRRLILPPTAGAPRGVTPIDRAIRVA